MSRKRRRETLTPELTPLIDVVFLLLIFFMVSSVFKNDELALLLKLPSSEQGENEQSKVKQMVIELTQDELAIDGKKKDFTQAEDIFREVDKKTIINLRVASEVQYQRLIKVLDILQEFKLENISLITEKKKK